MNPLATLVILGWIPLVLYLFNRFPAQRAVVVSYVTGFLFLPEVISYPIAPGIPVYNKASATTYCILLATFSTILSASVRLNPACLTCRC
jgi:hypothetical protein